MRTVILLADAADRLRKLYTFIGENDSICRSLREFANLPVHLSENSYGLMDLSSPEGKVLVSGYSNQLILHREMSKNKNFNDFL